LVGKFKFVTEVAWVMDGLVPPVCDTPRMRSTMMGWCGCPSIQFFRVSIACCLVGIWVGAENDMLGVLYGIASWALAVVLVVAASPVSQLRSARDAWSAIVGIQWVWRSRLFYAIQEIQSILCSGILWRSAQYAW
jgi:hypothetical protein